MRAAILSIGSELVHGFLTDTNATFLTQELQALGIDVTTVMQVSDDFQRLTLALRRSLEDAELVITTGGIGPTEDDLTREAIAEVAGEQVVVDTVAAERIREFFTARGIVMPEQNVKQAWTIPSSESLENPMGTAPGWFVRIGDRMIVTMPGVPREMFRMWREQAVPRILDRLDERAIVSRTLKTIGIGESAVETEIIDIVHRGEPVVATYAKDDGVHIRITALSSDAASAQAEVDATEQEIRSRIGAHVYGYLDDSLASSILRPLQERGGQLTVHEVGSGGRLITALFEAPESTNVMQRSSVASFERLFTPHTDMAAAATALCKDVNLSTHDAAVAIITHIGPGQNSDRAAGRIVIACRYGEQTEVREHSVSAVPHEIRRRATMWAMEFVWRSLATAKLSQKD